MCHNERLANPDDPITREIAAINAKSNKTEADRQEVFKLEWYGGLYTAVDISGPVIPTANIRTCLINAGKMTKKGKPVERAISFFSLSVPIAYEGPRDIDELWKQPSFRDIRMVRIRGRVPRCRPQFVHWSVIADAFFLDEALDFDVFQRIVEQAGLAEGLGDNRKNGFGRFIGEVIKR